MAHSNRIDPFCTEDEHFFGSYEAERSNSERSLTLELDAVEAQPPTSEQLAHFTRFRRPVAWIIAAMGSLSLLALGQHAFQQNPRGEVVAHMGSATAVLTPAAANNFAAGLALPSRSVFANAAEQTSEAPWSLSELAENAIALVFEPTPPSTSGSKLPSLADSEMQASRVDDFTSELLSMCRDARC